MKKMMVTIFCLALLSCSTPELHDLPNGTYQSEDGNYVAILNKDKNVVSLYSLSDSNSIDSILMKLPGLKPGVSFPWHNVVMA
jgi:hypothetical protein